MPKVSDYDEEIPTAGDTVLGLHDGAVSRFSVNELGRTHITTNLTYYVDPLLGSDSNDGLSAALPFQTVAQGIGAATSLDTQGWTVTIQLAAGTYTIPYSLVLYNVIGSGFVHLLGDETTPANVVLNFASGGAGGFYAGSAAAPYQWEISGVKISNSSGPGIEADGGFVYAHHITWGTCSAEHVVAHNHGVYYNNANETIVGGATYHWSSQSASLIRHRNKTVTLTSTPAFSGGFILADLADLQVDGNTFTGNATGPRFSFIQGGRAKLGTNSLTYFPGDTAGTLTSGFYNDLVAAAPLTVATLPSAAPAGTRAFVTNASTGLTFASSVTSSTANTALPVYSDGTIWRVG